MMKVVRKVHLHLLLSKSLLMLRLPQRLLLHPLTPLRSNSSRH
jgi:hypothetical protein